MIQEVFRKFADPPASYRGTPFWAWNAKLDPKEIREQIRVFHKMGLGGFFMHSRTGLATPYLGPEWFDCVRAAVDEAKKLGMQPWMYDEDRWPSGAAGGFVTKNKRYRQQWIGTESVPAEALASKADAPDTLAWFAERVRPEGSGLSQAELAKIRDEGNDRSWYGRPAHPILGYRRLKTPKASIRDGEIRVRYYVGRPGPDSWYNGQTYVDVLNPAAIRAFVRTTHEAYKRELGADFGSVVPGCFTDEPQFPSRPWTGAFAKTFRDTFGYDLLNHLPELFCAIGGKDEFSRVRHDYMETATALFVKAFSKTIGSWCGRNGLRFTGHVMCEDTLGGQTFCVGSAQRFYEFQQAPGIDQLTEVWSIYQTAKQCSSVAHQMGRAYRLVEAYGCSGWDFSLEGHKAIGDWLVALGINHRCQHLAWYSMSAEAKRDYPASISRQSPWHEKYKAVEDYFARIGEALGAGEEIIPVLVVNAVESVWGYCAQGDSAGVRKLSDDFLDLTGTLLGAHLDFDYGDEDHIARWGRLAGRRLRLRRAKYDAVVVPELRTIRRSTLDRLSAVAARGGRVVYLGEPPAFVDAQPSKDAVKAFAAFERVTLDTLPDALRKARRVSIRQRGKECADVLYQERASEDGLILFACNTSAPMPMPRAGVDQTAMPFVRDRRQAYPKAEIRIKAPARTGSVYELDLLTGKIHSVPFVHKAGWYRIPAPFGRLQSRLFFVTSAKVPAVPNPAAQDVAKELVPPKQGLSYALSDDNVLVLDHARYAVDGGAKSRITQVLDIDRALRRQLGKETRAGHMTQPWCSAERKPERSLALRLEYTFRCDRVPAGPVALAIERPDLYRIELNGVPLKNASSTWWVDPCLRRLALPKGALRKGTNTLVLSSEYNELLPGLEAMFLLGSFGVSPDGRTIRALPAKLDLGDVCRQGLPNYSGNLAYSFTAKVPKSGPVRLSIPNFRGTAIGLRLNGGKEVFLPFPPYEAVFDKGLKRDGKDCFEVTVYGHRRNAFGPFYLKDGIKWPHWHGPGQMGAVESTTRALVPFGLGASPRGSAGKSSKFTGF